MTYRYRIEDIRRIVGDCIDTTKLLEYTKEYAYYHLLTVAYRKEITIALLMKSP